MLKSSESEHDDGVREAVSVDQEKSADIDRREIVIDYDFSCKIESLVTRSRVVGDEFAQVPGPITGQLRMASESRRLVGVKVLCCWRRLLLFCRWLSVDARSPFRFFGGANAKGRQVDDRRLSGNEFVRPKAPAKDPVESTGWTHRGSHAGAKPTQGII